MDEIIITTPEKIREIIATCLAEHLTKNTSPGPPEDDDGYLKSIREIAEFLGCSTTTAQKFKNQNRHIFLQLGRKFMVKKEDVIDALRNKSRCFKR